MAFEKGQSGNPHGRPKGAVNKTTKALKEMILEALEGEGGVEYLQKQAKDNPTAFLTLVGKVLPMQVTDGDGGPLTVQIVRFADSKTSG